MNSYGSGMFGMPQGMSYARAPMPQPMPQQRTGGVGYSDPMQPPQQAQPWSSVPPWANGGSSGMQRPMPFQGMQRLMPWGQQQRQTGPMGNPMGQPPPFSMNQQPPNPMMGGGVMGANGQRYADRNSSPRAPTSGPFVAGAGMFGPYGQPGAGGFRGEVENGMNYINNGNGQRTLFQSQGLDSGGPELGNFVNYMNSYRR